MSSLLTSVNILQSLSLFTEALAQKPDILQKIPANESSILLQNPAFMTHLTKMGHAQALSELKNNLPQAQKEKIEVAWCGTRRPKYDDVPGLINEVLASESYKAVSTNKKNQVLIDGIFTLVNGISDPALKEVVIDDQPKTSFLNFTIESGQSDRLNAAVHSLDAQAQDRVHANWTKSICNNNPNKVTYFVSFYTGNVDHLVALRKQLSPAQQETVDEGWATYISQCETLRSGHVPHFYRLAQAVEKPTNRKRILESEKFKNLLEKNGMGEKLQELRSFYMSKTTDTSSAPFPAAAPSSAPKSLESLNPFLSV